MEWIGGCDALGGVGHGVSRDGNRACPRDDHDSCGCGVGGGGGTSAADGRGARCQRVGGDLGVRVGGLDGGSPAACDGSVCPLGAGLHAGDAKKVLTAAPMIGGGGVQFSELGVEFRKSESASVEGDGQFLTEGEVLLTFFSFKLRGTGFR